MTALTEAMHIQGRKAMANIAKEDLHFTQENIIQKRT